MTVTIQRTESHELAYIERLLNPNDLPINDIHADDVELYVGCDDSIRVGVGGVEAYRLHGLLRSVVIEEDQRDQGYGAELTQHLLREARHQGIDEMYLLTTAARKVSGKLGFQIADQLLFFFLLPTINLYYTMALQRDRPMTTPNPE